MKKFLLAVVILALVSGGWYWLKHRENAPAAGNENEKPAAKVETEPLKQQDIVQSLEAFGVVGPAPSGEHVIPAPYDCVIRQVFVGVGTPVAAGDVLMEIEPSHDTKLAFDSAKSALAVATTMLAATQERYDLKLITSPDLLAAQQAEQDARLKVASYESRGLGGDGKLSAAITGIVSKLELSSGALATIGTPLVSVASADQLEVRLGIEPANLASVVAGQRVVLISANRADGEKISSTVRTAGRGLDPVTGAAEIRVAVPSGAPLFLGEHVKASVEIRKKENALVAPRSAVQPDDDKQVLFTVKDGKAVKHEVKLGIAAGELVEVMDENLHVGDLVVTLGNYELTGGMEIQSAEKETKEADKKEQERQGTKEEKP